MKKIITLVMFIISGCGTYIPPVAVNQPPVVIQSPPQPQPVPVPVPNTMFHIGEIVFVRNWYGMVCRGQIVNTNYHGLYLLNPVICNNHLFYYNVVKLETELFR